MPRCLPFLAPLLAVLGSATPVAAQTLTIGAWTWTETVIASNGDVDACQTNAAAPNYRDAASQQPFLKAIAHVDERIVAASSCAIKVEAQATITVGPGETLVEVLCIANGVWELEDTGGDVSMAGFVYVDGQLLTGAGPTPVNRITVTTPTIRNQHFGLRSICLAPGNHQVRAELTVTATCGPGVGSDNFKSDYFGAGGFTVRLQTGDAKEHVIPVKVFVQPGVAVTKHQATKIIDAANGGKLLGQAKFRLEYDPSKHFHDNFNEGGDNNDRITGDEISEARQRAVDRLKLRISGFDGRGYALVFTNQIDGDNGNLGYSWHHSQLPVSLIMKGTGAGAQSLDEMGATVAHEICHQLTLSEGHRLTTTRDADATGHDNVDPDNLMWATAVGQTDTKLTRCQVDEVKLEGSAGSRALAKRVAGGVVVADQTRHGLWTDDADDATDPRADLQGGELFIPDADGSIRLRTLFHPALADTDSVRVTLQYLFDTDHSSGTGIDVPPWLGIDAIVRVTMDGRFPFQTQPGSVIGELIDTQTGIPADLRPVRLATELRFADGETTSVSVGGVLVEVECPLDALGFSADTVPYGVMAWEGSAPLDVDAIDAGAEFTHVPPEGPSLTMTPLESGPGLSVNLAGTGFSPAAAVELLVDSLSIAFTMTDASGNLATSLPVPSIPQGNYVVTARDSTSGAFDYALLEVIAASGVPASPGGPPRRLALIGPGPVAAGSGIRFTYEISPPGEEVRIALYDVAGRQVRLAVQGWQEGGRHVGVMAFGPDTSLAAGLYFLTLRTERHRESVRVVVVD